MTLTRTCSMMGLAVMLAACTSSAPGDPFARSVEEFSPSDSGGFGIEDFPEVVLGPPVGGGETSGSTDVLSLGCGGSIVLGFGPGGIENGPGPDFIVFENPFVPASGGEAFVEPGEVSVSADGESWTTFPCILEGDRALEGCAGVGPVLSSPDSGIDPTDPASAGGDSFDLADVGVARARFVRIVDRTEEYYGTSLWCSPPKGGFDLDAVGVVSP